MRSDVAPGAPELEAIRHQLAVLARRPDARVTEFSTRRPTEWRPHEVTSPLFGLPYTDSEAWEFVAQHLEKGHALTEVILEKPMGKKAYVMLIDLADGKAPVYVKLQLGCGKVIGRSFHRSTLVRKT